MNAATEKSERKGRDLDDEIAKAEAKLKKLRDERIERDRKTRERNVKAVMDLLRAEGLDDVPAEHWKIRIGAVKAALEGNGDESTGVGAQAGQRRATAASVQAEQPANV